jgi:hypothetical protein
MTLSDEERSRIEEEERFRAAARLKAEAEARRRLDEDRAAQAAEEKRATRKNIKLGGLGCLGLTILLIGIGSLLPKSKDQESARTQESEGNQKSPRNYSLVLYNSLAAKTVADAKKEKHGNFSTLEECNMARTETTKRLWREYGGEEDIGTVPPLLDLSPHFRFAR